MHATLKQPSTMTRSTHEPALREKLLRELRGGPTGVALWNARTAEERKEIETLPRLDLSGAELPGANLGCLTLNAACFDGATLTKAWLLESKLKQATFQGANLDQVWGVAATLQGADFTKATLTRANLRECDCRDAIFRDANLTGATLSGANLCGADLSSANLRDAILDETTYDERTRLPWGRIPPAGLRWVGAGEPPLDFDSFVSRIRGHVEAGRLGRALEMLKADRFQLYSQVESESVAGIVKSQREENLVYSCRLNADGGFACCSQDLSPCLGLRGALCKHIMVLIIGLTRAGKAEAAVVERWVKASRAQTPILDEDVMSEPLLRYQAARTGTLDWRPTETIPEDYYTL
jgi:hypothetical protein